MKPLVINGAMAMSIVPNSSLLKYGGATNFGLRVMIASSRGNGTVLGLADLG